MPCIPTPDNHSGDPARDGSRCKCYNAVMNAYEGVKKDVSKNVADEVALRVYRHHHPEDCITLAKLTVERWIYGGTVH